MTTPKPLHDRLIAEACAALIAAGFVDPDDGTMPTFVERPYPEGRMDVWKPSEAAARAVLEPVLRLMASTVNVMSKKTLENLADRINPNGRNPARPRNARRDKA